MKVNNFERDLFGSASFQIEATPEETAVLINIALEYLIRAGKITLDDINSREFGINLGDIPIEEMFNA